MSNFKELNQNLEIVIQEILLNQNLCKLIKYNSPNALSQPDLENPNDLLFTKIYPYPRSTEIFNEASSILMVGFNNFKPLSANSFVNEYLYFRILCHEQIQRTDEGLRVYQIAHEIANLFNNQRIIGMGKTLFYGGGEIISKNYSGFELVYKVTSIMKENKN